MERELISVHGIWIQDERRRGMLHLHKMRKLKRQGKSVAITPVPMAQIAAPDLATALAKAKEQGYRVRNL
jgi:hypothetical protein